MKKLNLKMQGIGEMLSKEQMKNVVGGYGCPNTLGQACTAYYQPWGGNVSGICSNSPSGPCECRVNGTLNGIPNTNLYLTPTWGCAS
jgi:hypothetical protein